MLNSVGSEPVNAFGSEPVNAFAKESKTVQKMRAKLAEKWSKDTLPDTQLNNTKEKIVRVYARGQDTRVSVKGKDMALFASGKGVKEPSLKVRAIMEEIQRNFA